jgi:hypothetical protein
MNDKTFSRRRLLIVVALSALFAISVMAIAWYTSPIHADVVDCSGDWYNSTDSAVVDACGKQKADAGATQMAADMATMTSQPWVLADTTYTVGPVLPEPDGQKVVMPKPYDPENSTAPEFSGSTTVWLDGDVPRDDYTVWDELFVLTRPGNGASYYSLYPDHAVITVTTNPTLETIVFGSAGGVTDGGEGRFQKVWTDPHADGALYITNITNPAYTNTDPAVPYPDLQSVVYFTTKLGQTGHFDMATATWTFDVMNGSVPTPTAPLAYP